MRKLLTNSIATGLASLILNATNVKAQGPYEPDLYTKALYHLNETEGTNVTDATGINHGSAFGEYEWVNGIFSNSIRLINADVQIPHRNQLNLDDQITLEAWVFPDTLLSAHSNNIIRKELGSGIGEQYLLRINESYQLDFVFALRNGFFGRISQYYQFQNRQWYHVAGTYDGLNHKLWVNRQLIAHQIFPSDPLRHSNQGYMFIGHSLNDDKFYGKIDEVRVSSIARDFSTTSTPDTDPRISTWGKIKSLFK